jgi:hypothetical protein
MLNKLEHEVNASNLGDLAGFCENFTKKKRRETAERKQAPPSNIKVFHKSWNE